jgi:aldose 1-epimerase
MVSIQLIMIVFAQIYGQGLVSSKSKIVDPKNFDTTIQDQKVGLYTLENKNGVIVQITNYGGKIVTIIVPDKNGNFDDVVTGYETIEGYLEGDGSFGAIIGRYGNRIAKGQFTIDGKSYELAKNNGNNHLHGGINNFSKKVWKVHEKESNRQKLTLSYFSKDGEEGYPGNLDVSVVYSLTDQNELLIDYHATTDKATHVNLTNHSYFNLAGGKFDPVYDHVVQINAKKFAPADKQLIPLGELWEVSNTPMDFRKPTSIGKHIHDDYEQLVLAGGYDHTFVLDNEEGKLMTYAYIYEPKTGRTMECLTAEPGVQFYTANHFNGKQRGKNGVSYQKHAAFCLETQHYPDSPNQPDFPSTLLMPEDVYHTTTVYRFGIK